MEVHFSEDIQARVTRLASEQGRDAESFVREAVERAVNYDEWFGREIEKGIAAPDRGELIEHDEVKKLIDRRYANTGSTDLEDIFWFADSPGGDFRNVCCRA